MRVTWEDGQVVTYLGATGGRLEQGHLFIEDPHGIVIAELDHEPWMTWEAVHESELQTLREAI